MNAQFLKQKHEAGLSYADYLAAGKPEQRENWQKIYDQVQLTESQMALLGSFKRRINAICISGIWCGDCVQQGPLIQRIVEGSAQSIDLRWLDRDEHMDLQEQISINAGHRVPVVIFCAEDFEPVCWYGDRTLSRYRAMAQKQLVGACPLPGAPVGEDELAATVADWLEQFERVHLLLRLSGRFRQMYGD